MAWPVDLLHLNSYQGERIKNTLPFLISRVKSFVFPWPIIRPTFFGKEHELDPPL
jgi:hypothetical protein